MTDAFAHLSSGFPPHGEGNGGDEGNRTLDPLLAGQVLSQLSYTPSVFFFTGVFYLTIPEN